MTNKCPDFYVKFSGSKRKELHHIADIVDGILKPGMRVVEPFGGSLAFSRWLFHLRKDLVHRVSDVDVPLLEFCNEFHKDAPGYLARAKELMDGITSREEYRDTLKAYTKGLTDAADKIPYWFMFKTWSAAGYGGYVKERPKYRNYLERVQACNEFFAAHTYEQRHYREVFDEFRDDENALLYLDPPYMTTSNEWYYYKDDSPKEGPTANELMWGAIRDMFESARCRIILCVKHDMWMDLLFKPWHAVSYPKMYSASKARVTHNVYIK